MSTSELSNNSDDDDDLNPDIKIKNVQVQTNDKSRLTMDDIRASADELLTQELLQEKDKEIHKWKIQCKEHVVQERMSIHFNEILTTFTQRMNLLEEKIESNTKVKRR